jgi:hypothetical protein
MTRNDAPSFLRALLVPWSLASVLFVVFSAGLLAFFLGKGVYGVVGSYFLLSWFFKYAYVVLEHVANGHLEAPVASVEMLGPFEQRPLILVAWCLITYTTARTLGGAAGTALVTLVLLMLPATVAVLGLGSGVFQSINPLTLWRTMRGLGIYYLGALGLMAAAATLIFVMEKMDAWNMLTIAVAEVAVLTVFSTLGGALFVRRLEIGHEPIVSPERQVENEDREHSRALSAMLDDLYTQARLKKHEPALNILGQWFAQTDDRYIVSDANTIGARVAAWNDSKALGWISRALVAELEKRGKPEAATTFRQA